VVQSDANEWSRVARNRGPGYENSYCLDPFHVVKLGTEALEEVRKDLWREMRKLPSPVYARKFAGARWALLKNPGTLTKRQVDGPLSVVHFVCDKTTRSLFASLLCCSRSYVVLALIHLFDNPRTQALRPRALSKGMPAEPIIP
jgi:hypothetical protein